MDSFEKKGGKISPDYRESKQAWTTDDQPPESSPNVVLVIFDDVGFAQLGCYGSTVRTPNIDALADNGLRLRNFQTTGMCSATRSCLMTGRNHHANHIGAVAEVATGYPGYDFRLPKENGMVSEVLLERGYATFAMGKWHLTPADEYTMGSTRSRWPLARGFERFYGFHGGDTSHYFPNLVHDNHQIPQPASPDEGYHLTEDLVDHAIEFVRDLHNAAPGKPFFMYFGLGAAHTPLHVPTEYIDRYKGEFDLGWDEWREVVYRRQLEMGILPEGTQLTPRPEWVPAWDSLTETEKKVGSRLMEIYAAFLEHTDTQIGRLIDDLRETGKLDNTIFIVLSDNGASSEGGVSGKSNNVRYVNGIAEDAEEISAIMDKLGSVETNPHYPYGWAWAGNTPFRRWKQEVHAGGVQDPFIISWPKGLPTDGSVRSQYAHAIDLFPTLLDFIGLEAPERISHVPQTPIHGVSMASWLTDPVAESDHYMQYFEMKGCRGLYYDGWKVVTYRPRIGLAWDGSDPMRPLSQDPWELYKVSEDFSEMFDVSSEHPEIVGNLVERWWVEAGKYDVLPLDNRGVSRLGDRKEPPYSPGGSHTIYRSSGTIGEYASFDVKNRSHSIKADLVVEDGMTDGVVVSMGNGYGGWALFVKGGCPYYCYNYASKEEFLVKGNALPTGAVTLEMQFEKTGEHQGHARLLVNGEEVGDGPIPNTVPVSYNNGDMAVGFNAGYAVSREYRDEGRFRFAGEIKKIDLSRERAGSTDRKELVKVAMAIQ